MPNENDYRRPMRRFMSFLDGVEYENADIPGKFTTEKLASIKPEDILKWMNKLVYGNENPSDNHDMSPLIRSSTVEQWKKGISHWMPMQTTAWIPHMGVGNPTRSKLVNDFIKKIKKKEVRKLGAPSKARRSIEKQEFLNVRQILKTEGKDRVWKYGIPVRSSHHIFDRLRLIVLSPAFSNLEYGGTLSLLQQVNGGK